jgi:ribosomal protein S18 acetylase RimI-like enzyme
MKDSDMVKIKLMRPGEEMVTSDLAVSTFQRYVAPLYTEEGIREFLSYANPSALQSRQASNHVVLVAFQGVSIVGMLELRDYCHVSMLFVDHLHQRKGIGRMLVNKALRLIQINSPEVREVTVSSAPNVVEAYIHFGFQVTGELQVKNGIAFVPMTLALEMKDSD